MGYLNLIHSSLTKMTIEEMEAWYDFISEDTDDMFLFDLAKEVRAHVYEEECPVLRLNVALAAGMSVGDTE